MGSTSVGTGTQDPAKEAAKNAENARRDAESKQWDREREAYLNWRRETLKEKRRWVRRGERPEKQEQQQQGGIISGSLKPAWMEYKKIEPGIYDREPEGSSKYSFEVDKDGSVRPRPPTREGFGEAMDMLANKFGASTIVIDWPQEMAKGVNTRKLLELIKLADHRGLGVQYGPVVQAFLNDPKSKIYTTELGKMIERDKEEFSNWLAGTGKASFDDLVNKNEKGRLYLEYCKQSLDMPKMSGLLDKEGRRLDFQGATKKQIMESGLKNYRLKTDYMHEAKSLDQQMEKDRVDVSDGKTFKDVLPDKIKNKKITLDDLKTRIAGYSDEIKRIQSTVTGETKLLELEKDGAVKAADLHSKELDALKNRTDMVYDKREALLGKYDEAVRHMRDIVNAASGVDGMKDKAGEVDDKLSAMEDSLKVLKQDCFKLSKDGIEKAREENVSEEVKARRGSDQHPPSV